MFKKLNGYKTYIILGIAVILGGIDTYNAHCLANAVVCKAFSVPPFIYSILAGLGIYTRSLVGK